MNKILLFSISIILFSNCSENKEIYPSHPTILDDDSYQANTEIQRNRITHGDTPVWISHPDIEIIEKLLAERETVDKSTFLFNNKPLNSYRENDFKKLLNLKEVDRYKDFHLSKGNGVQLSVKSGEITYINISNFENLTCNGLPMESLNIESFKEAYPTAYGLRNMIGDDHVEIYLDGYPDVYDHTYLNVENSNAEIHLRWVDGKVINVTYKK